jgi:hypothetical protein
MSIFQHETVISVVQEYRGMGDSWPKAITCTVREAYGRMVVRLRGEPVDHRPRNNRVGSAMVAHAIMKDDEALELLAREHDDPAALAVAVAIAARNILFGTSIKLGDLFELEDLPYRIALVLAQEGAAED